MRKLKKDKPFPGPYFVGKNYRNGNATVHAVNPTDPNRRPRICECPGWAHRRDEWCSISDTETLQSVQDATARLLAASWEMQEVLKEVDEWMNKIIDDYSRDIHDKVIAAIKKAKYGT